MGPISSFECRSAALRQLVPPKPFPYKLLSKHECQIHCNMFLHRVNNNINAALHLCMCTGLCTGLTFSTQLDIFRPKKCGGEVKWSVGVRKMCVSPVSHPIYLPNTLCESPDIWTGQNRSPILLCGANNEVEYYGKRIIILHGPNRAWLSRPFLSKWVGWPCPVRSVLKRTTVLDFILFQLILILIHI